MSEEHPAHYNKGKIEVWEFIADQAMGFLEGNIVKYLCRYRYKGAALKDLHKARAYLDRLIVERQAFELEQDRQTQAFKERFEAVPPAAAPEPLAPGVIYPLSKLPWQPLDANIPEHLKAKP